MKKGERISLSHRRRIFRDISIMFLLRFMAALFDLVWDCVRLAGVVKELLTR